MEPTFSPVTVVPLSSANPFATIVPELSYTKKYMLAPGPVPASQVRAKQGAQSLEATLCAWNIIDPCPEPAEMLDVAKALMLPVVATDANKPAAKEATSRICLCKFIEMPLTVIRFNWTVGGLWNITSKTTLLGVLLLHFPPDANAVLQIRFGGVFIKWASGRLDLQCIAKILHH